MAQEVPEILVERGQQWGDPVDTHARIAEVWSGILGTEVATTDVALMMAGLKLVRAAVNPTEKDSFDDGIGYLRIGAMIEGHDPDGLAELRGQ